MITVTIPKEVTRGEELVVIPRKLYEEFLRVIKRKSTTTFKLNKGLREALADVKTGRVIGPFTTLSEGLQTLKRTR